MKRLNKNVIKSILKTKELGILFVLILLCVLVEIANPIFLTYGNIMDVLRNASYTLIVALGMTFVLVGRGLDLSVGSVLALSGLVSAAGMFYFHLPIFVSVSLGLICGAIFGCLNALFIVKLKIPPMIATLGSLYMARGLVLVLTKGSPIYPLPQEFSQFGKSYIVGIPYIVLLAAILSISSHVLLKYTIFGRKVYAIGGNPETAKFAGINVNRITISVYMLCSTLAALSGILISARMGSGQPSVGDGTEMTVITAVIIGGVSLNGGAGTVLGTVLGTILMSVLASGMNLVGVSPYWQKFVMGMIIVVAVGFDQYQRSKRKAA